MQATNHDRAEHLVGPRWSQRRPRYIVNVFVPRYDDVLDQTTYRPAFSVQKTSEMHLRNTPEVGGGEDW